MSDDRDPNTRGRSRLDAAVDLLSAYSTWIGAAAVVVVGLVWWSGASVPEVPRPLIIGGLAAVAGITLGWIPAKKVVAWLYSPNWRYLVSLDAQGNDLEVWRLSPDAWEALDVAEGELYELQAIVPAYECATFDPGALEATGTWRGSKSDMELLQERERIKEIRQTLEEQAQEGIALRMRVGSIVRSAVGSIVNDLVEQYEQRAVHGGERIEQAVSEALEDHEIQQDEEDERESQQDTMTVETDEARENGQQAVADGGSDGTE